MVYINYVFIHLLFEEDFCMELCQTDAICTSEAVAQLQSLSLVRPLIVKHKI